MGWLYGWNSKQELVKHLEDLEENANYTIVKSTTIGNHWWAVIEGKPGSSLEGERLAVLCLLGSHDREWGYKDMDETMGPYYYDCPISYLSMLTEPRNDSARAWREQVKKYNDDKAKAKTLKSLLKEGSTVVVYGNEYKLTRYLARKGWEACRVSDGMLFRITARQINQGIMAMLNAA